MGVIKAKNSAGEWVDVAMANSVTIEGSTSTAGLYIDVITPITLTDGRKAFDLTKYENCNRFIILYSAKSTTASNSYFYRYAYDTANVDGNLKILDSDLGNVDRYGYGINCLVTGSGQTGVNRGIYDTQSSYSVSMGNVSSYPDATIASCIFTQENHIFGDQAIVIYAM